MKRLEIRLTGLTEKRLREYRKLPTESFFGAPLAVVVIIAAGLVTAIRHGELFEPSLAAINLIAESSSERTGDCTGTINTSAIRGYEDDPVIPTIRIDPPYDSIIAKVITDNPGCPQCEASRTEDGTFTRELTFQGRGPFRVGFVALDGEGKERCRGQTVELEALGPRP